jgi:hypothetical protein
LALLISSAVLLVSSVAGTLSAHPLIANHVVLQTTDEGGEGAIVSGAGVAGETVTLSILSGGEVVKKADAVADQSGAWRANVSMASGGPYTLQFVGSASPNTVNVADVLFGDVYICSGQSNMVFPIGGGNNYTGGQGPQAIDNSTAELLAANHPDMRAWFVPSYKTTQLDVSDLPEFTRLDYVKENNNAIALGAETPVKTLAGGCNISSMCYEAAGPNPAGCANSCNVEDGGLLHEWTAITPQTLGPISAVCYIAVRNAKMAHAPNRPVGIIASYVGGTPVGCWANDADADHTCGVVENQVAANYPCDPTKACCPQRLYNEKIAPLLPFNTRAALWYQVSASAHAC